MPAESPEQFRRLHSRTIERLYAESDARRFNVSLMAFGDALYRSYRRRADTGPDFANGAEIDHFLDSLHVHDLSLAIACREGVEQGWNEFVAKYGAAIEAAARSLISDRGRACEAADSLHAELYGLHERDGRRSSPFDQYHGRAPLAAWLRAVIVRREADRWRAERHYESIDKVGEIAVADGEDNHSDPDRARYLPMLGDSLARAIAGLEPRDRLRLSYYYVQELTLAEIGRLMGEHESTVSRKIAASRERIRCEVERLLKSDHRLSDDQIDRCFEYATGDWPFNLAQALSPQAK